MINKVKGVLAILLLMLVIGLSSWFIPEFLVNASNKSLPLRDAQLPVIFIVASLCIGLFMGIWIGKR